MELTGEYRIRARRETVWAMLNDPQVLRECIPGCQALEGTPESGFSAKVTTKIGPVKATFDGAVTLSNVRPPEGYTISGEGKGGVAGFAKGGADVRLVAEGADTILTYKANAQVGGKLAQLGSRLVDSTAKKLADEFFACFARKAGADATPPAAEPMILPGEAVPAAAAGIPIVSGQAAPLETVPPIGATPLHHVAAASAVPPATAAEVSAGHMIQEAAHEVEEEVEAKAAMGFLGGPIVWGLLAIIALLLVLAVT
jgi:carbon monoxide dehydrogenase subunit G